MKTHYVTVVLVFGYGNLAICRWNPSRSHGQTSSPQRFMTFRTILLDSVSVMRSMKSNDRCAKGARFSASRS